MFPQNEVFFRRLRRVCMVLPIIMLAANVVCWLRWGTDLPFFDDWYALSEGQSKSLRISRLFKTRNDTVGPVGLALDTLAQRWLGGNPLPYQTLSMLFVLGGMLWLQWCLLGWVLRKPIWQSLAFVLTFFMLQPGTYWGEQNIAYHQALPLLALFSASWLNFCSSVHTLPRLTGVALLGLLSGLSYISGAIGSLVIGGAWLLQSCLICPTALRKRSLSGGFMLGLAGALTTTLQVWLSIAQDSARWIFYAWPNEGAFWFFAAGVLGRSTGAGFDALVAEIFWVILLFFAWFFAIVFALRGIKAVNARHRRFAVVCFPLLVCVVSYLAMVSFGRAHLAPSPQNAENIFLSAYNRFHFFWLTLLWPWITTSFVLMSQRRAVPVFITALMIFFSIAVCRGVFDVPSYYRNVSKIRETDIRYVMSMLNGGDPSLYEWRLAGANFMQSYLHARAVGASFVRYFPLVERHGFGREMLRLGHGEGAWQFVQDAGHGWKHGTGESHMLLSLPGTENCQVIGLQVTMQARYEGASKLYYRHLGQTEFEERRSVRKPYNAGEVELEFVLDNPGGFEPHVRFHPLAGDGLFRTERIRASCLLPKEMP